jgi:hypothetical protein
MSNSKKPTSGGARKKRSSKGQAKSYRSELIPPSVRVTTAFLMRELKNNGVRYVLAGAFPVQFYGRERLSRDLDVVICLDQKSAENVFKLLKSGRYTLIYPLEYEEKMDSPNSLFKLNLVKIRDKKTESLIDLILNPSEVGFEFNSESEKRMRTIDVDGEEAYIPSPEDYLIMKFKSRRPGTHDFEDIVSTLTAQFDNLDWDYLTKRAEKQNLISLLNHYRSAFEAKVGKE